MNLSFYLMTKSDKIMNENRKTGNFYFEKSFENEYIGKGLFINIGLGFFWIHFHYLSQKKEI